MIPPPDSLKYTCKTGDKRQIEAEGGGKEMSQYWLVWWLTGI